ncbi:MULTISPECIES: KTSC domain-containing protein [Sphingomonadales]|uniref:KTSC domain-containing protein n=1 Tax=Edaphosphingomonas haloaromaticamans TaxID=653954 RepID=A0A1S1H890_9SPHN|nr:MULTISPECIES: KTSC domain-containing protein [Sphingomonas]AGH50001.1 lysyl-tRNA synthetase [Sphingomonas sp. MM-1]MDX3883137.1 KTSC domain-containing protein [Sphingomonas sp.]OHT18358.1 hypothetical protein BHE75_00329 [Sphingomonas haloaromaticamans]
MPSSVIRAFDYDPDGHRLLVRFVGGRLYRYSDVPAEIVRQFRAAPSRGRFFNRRIRDRFPAERID